MLKSTSGLYTAPLPSVKVSFDEECAENMGTDEQRIKYRKNAGLDALTES